MIELFIDSHPMLRTSAFVTNFEQSLEEGASPDWLVELLRMAAAAPLQRSEELRAAVRDMLRHGGYKPTGRGKPASEYLVRAAEDGSLRSINAAVDACNAVSLHSGFPIRSRHPGTSKSDHGSPGQPGRSRYTTKRPERHASSMLLTVSRGSR